LGKINEELIGEVEIILYKGKKFILDTKFKQASAELYFLLFMVDRILFDIEDMDHKQSVSSMLARYISNQRNEREKLDNLFNNYQANSEVDNKILFQTSHKLYKNNINNGPKFKLKTDYSSHEISNFDGKLSISTMLYVIDLVKRFPVENLKFISDIYTAMLQEYFDTGFPTNKTLGLAPVKAISSVIKNMK